MNEYSTLTPRVGLLHIRNVSTPPFSLLNIFTTLISECWSVNQDVEKKVQRTHVRQCICLSQLLLFLRVPVM